MLSPFRWNSYILNKHSENITKTMHSPLPAVYITDQNITDKASNNGWLICQKKQLNILSLKK